MRRRREISLTEKNKISGLVYTEFLYLKYTWAIRMKSDLSMIPADADYQHGHDLIHYWPFIYKPWGSDIIIIHPPNSHAV